VSVCVACGEMIEVGESGYDNHHCEPHKENRRNGAMKSERFFEPRSWNTRLREGMWLLAQTGDRS
jgi:hypothetical protein